jgi:hypothetical protein
MTGTKKTAVMTLSIGLAIAVALLLAAGCGGGPAAQARDLATKAKSLETALNKTTGDLGKEVAALFAAVASGVPAKASFQSAADKIRAQVESVSKSVESMKTDYYGIKKLKGVEAYAEWADLQLQALDLTGQSMDSINRFLEKVGQMYSSGTPDQAALALAVAQLKTELADQSGKTVPLIEKANQFAEQNKLF